VLGIEEVGVDDPFLELGGDSLRATQVIARVLDQLQVEVPIQALMEAPTVVSMAELIMHRMGNEGGHEKEKCEKGPAIIPRKEGPPYALSFAQERMWILNHLENVGSTYNNPLAYRIKGILNKHALKQALQTLVTRHESLRTTIHMGDESPVQVIHSIDSIEIKEFDLCGDPAGSMEEHIERLMIQEIDIPFDLAQDVMLRANLIRLGEEEHILLLVIHHISSDGWSFSIIFRELGELYTAYVNGRAPDLPDLPIQYSDYALWQRERVKSERIQDQLSYWKERFASSPAILDLPADRPRPPRQTYRGARDSLVLPESLSESIKALSRKEGCTLFMTLLAAFQTLAHRLTGQDDIVVGTPIAERNRREFDDVIGIFLNTLALRSDLSGNRTFRELLAHVREVTLGAYDHQDIPFELLIEELQPERDLSRTPLIQVLFNMFNFPDIEFKMAGLTVETFPLPALVSIFDFTLYAKEENRRIHFDLVYNTDLFDAATIQRFRGHLKTLLEEVVQDPDRPISTIPILRDAKRQKMLVEWNDTQADHPDACIHKLFEAQAKLTPEAVAAIFEDGQVTYRELNSRANQLAHHLNRLGIQAEDRVGLFIERSLDTVVGLLGVLKAGAAYVPMDPIYPPERVAFMLEDAQASVLLIQSALAAQLPETEGKVICLDSDGEKISRESAENPGTETTPESLAYLIYTSGSTGKPKGVLGVHRATINRFAWMWRAFPFESGEVACQRAPLSVVAAVWEIF
jgi:acyl carrier protein